VSRGDQQQGVESEFQECALPAFLLPTPAYYTNVIGKAKVQLAGGQPFLRSGSMNRLQLVGPEGYVAFTFPVDGGRRQRKVVSEIALFDFERQSNQFRKTLQTLYGKSPFFEYYQPALWQLLESPFVRLIDLTLALNHWVTRQLKWPTVWELSHSATALPIAEVIEPLTYYQTFADRTGFLNQASILDLLFNEGPASNAYLLKLSQFYQPVA